MDDEGLSPFLDVDRGDAGGVVARTARLVLRSFVASDAAFIVDLLNDPAFLEFIGDRQVRTLEDARDYIARGPQAMYARSVALLEKTGFRTARRLTMPGATGELLVMGVEL